jgi:hypothetical protein
MTYSQGNVVLAADFNNFVGNGVSGPNLNATWNSTYGQTAVPTVAATGVVTAPGYWTSLNANLTSAATHQGTSITSRTNPTTGAVITALANVATDISSVYTNRYNSNVATSQFTGYTGASSFNTNIGNTAANIRGAWTATFTDTITFANSTAANTFFAAGGYAQVQFGKNTSGTVTDTEWNAFIGAAGAGGVVASKVVLTADAASKNLPSWPSVLGTGKTGGTGTPATLATTIGFNQLTTSPQTIYKQSDAGLYTGNYVQINASKNAGGNVVTLTTTWVEAGGDIGANTTITGGTLTTGVSFGTGAATVVTLYPPETTNISNVWGSYSVASSVANT